jgi:DHA3 family macrolide efflux protein-like MFS transporter
MARLQRCNDHACSQSSAWSIWRMFAYSITPLAYLVAGSLAEGVFEPLFLEGGKLASNLGTFIGVGPGRGTGFLFILAGIMWLVAVQVTMVHPQVRKLEIEIPDAVS